MIENNMRRALTASNGDYLVFVEKPISLVLLVIALLWIAVPFFMKLRGKTVIVNEDM
ncbi:Tricarboxylate transport membrane protein tctA [Geobacillus sp. WSUCF1]|nr:Tricarboxylate transport membrane protein tctA [Geobacillus sp. WSUCF1]